MQSYVFQHKEIPQTFDGKKIIFITDIHTDSDFTKADLRTLIDRVNNLKPDIILMGGDYVSAHSYINDFLDEIYHLEAKYGIYAVLGNHDHWSGAEVIAAGLENAGIHLCDNRSHWLRVGGDSIKLGGVGDWWCDKTIPENTINDISNEDFCIMLSHQPNSIDDILSDKIDLMLSGHTHAGQITFFGLWAPIMPGQFSQGLVTSKREYRYGWLRKGKTNMYISSGIGMGGVPFRFFAHPEIVVMTLKKK